MKEKGRIAACERGGGWRAGTRDHGVNAGVPTGAAALPQNRRRVGTPCFSPSVPHNKLCLLSEGDWTGAGAGGGAAAASRADVSHVEVNHVLRVGPLDRDGEGLEGVEGEGHQTSDGVVDRPPQKARLDLELQQAGVASIKPVWGVRKSNHGAGLLHMQQETARWGQK